MKNTNGWIIRGAIGIALIIILQLTTRSLGQVITGGLVNLVLASLALLFGWKEGALASVASPIIAFFLGINPQLLIIPAIALGNLTYVLLIATISRLLKSDDPRSARPPIVGSTVSFVVGSFLKFAVQFFLIVKWIAPTFLAEDIQAQMADKFGPTQILTAFIGGAIASLLHPLLLLIYNKYAGDVEKP